MTKIAKATDRRTGPTVGGSSDDLQAGTFMAVGTVKALVTERDALVDIDGRGQVHATQAVGCLLAPAIDDQVAVFVADGAAHILSVLERSPDRIAQVGVVGASEVELTGEAFKISASRQLTLSAPDMLLTATRLMSLVETLTQTGKRHVLNVAKSIETVVDKITTARSHTTVADVRTSTVKTVDTQNSGSLIQTVDKVATQNSDVTLITATNDVRLDAKRVSVS